jgi:hypothetical protein
MIISVSRCTSAIMLFVAIFVVGASAQNIELGTACEPYGSVTIESQPASNNLVVIAYVGDIELARCHTANGQYSLFIPRDDLETPQREGYRDGEIITIRVNGNPTNPAFEAFAGRQRRDLEVSTLAIRLETWGRIKALFR